MDIAGQSLAILLGAVGGGLLGSLSVLFTWSYDSRARTARDLLLDGLAIHAMKEAWILDGPGYENLRLSEHSSLGEAASVSGPWLRCVEVRSVLDQARWNAPKNQLYGFLESGRRAWVVRDQVVDGALSYPRIMDGSYLNPHPALLSSRGCHELCGWVERIAGVVPFRFCWLSRLFISEHGLRTLRPLLISIAGDDRMDVLGNRLTPNAREFLKWYRKNYKLEEIPPGKSAQDDAGAHRDQKVEASK